MNWHVVWGFCAGYCARCVLNTVWLFRADPPTALVNLLLFGIACLLFVVLAMLP
jgi:hypothetical protein